MSTKRQNNQLELAFLTESRSEAPRGVSEGTERLVKDRGTESSAIIEQLMEEVVERENCQAALKQVKANKGGPRIDGMTVDELPEYLVQHWPIIREQLLSGTYQPQPVKRVEIPKPDGGGVRKLGIPSVLDRFIQQARRPALCSPCLSADKQRRMECFGVGRFYNASGTGRFLSIATGSARAAQPVRRSLKRSSTSCRGIAGWLIWI
jgi:hypothetical protein